MTWQQKESKAGLSKGMKAMIVAMVLIILVPVMVVSAPLSKVVVDVTNTDDTLTVDVTVYLFGSDYHSFSFVLLPGEMKSVSCSVHSGTHDVRVDYNYAEDPYYPNMRWNTYSVGPFETAHVEFDLYPGGSYYY